MDAVETATVWWVYMVQTRTGKLYTGITTDIERRIDEHRNSRQRGAKFFRVDAAAKVVYREKVENRSAASRREAAIKKLSRNEKLELLEKFQMEKTASIRSDGDTVRHAF